MSFDYSFTAQVKLLSKKKRFSETTVKKKRDLNAIYNQEEFRGNIKQQKPDRGVSNWQEISKIFIIGQLAMHSYVAENVLVFDINLLTLRSSNK